MKNSRVYQQFEQSIRWNALEAGAYHSLLLLHQIALFFVIPSSLYGLTGTIFSLIYLTITITNGGLDSSLPIFFPSRISSQYHFRHTILKQLIPELILLVTGACIGIWYMHAMRTLSLTLSCGIGCLLITEGLRKTTRTLLQLLFFNKILLFIELFALLFYIIIVWLWVIIGHPLTLYHIFIPMLISSTLALGAKIATLSSWYRQLPARTDSLVICSRTILRHRFFNYVTQLGHTLFSSNFLVPLFAARFGLHSAALFKIISWCVQAVSLCFKKIFSIPGTALLAHIRITPLATRQHAFSLITHKTHYWLCILLIMCSIIPYALIKLCTSEFCAISYTMLSAYILLTLSEHFFMTYEIFFITQEKTTPLCFLTCFSLGLLAATLHATRFSSSSILLCGIFIARLCSFICMSLTAFLFWRIQPLSTTGKQQTSET